MSIEQRGLEAREISKRYGHTQALASVGLSLTPGHVHGLVGHNGAGKSTLLRVLSGAEAPDSGHLVLDGHPIAFGSPREAIEHGVSCVYQELSLVDDLTVAQNLFLGREMRQGMRLRLTEMERQTSKFLADFGLAIPATAKVRQLSVAQRQLLEVIIALHRDVRYLLLDEPTTSLEVSQIEYLLQTVRRVAREHDVAVLLVDHRLDEVYAVADYVTALQDGRVVLSGSATVVRRDDVFRVIAGVEARSRGAPSARVRGADGGPGETPPEPSPDDIVLVARDIRSDNLASVSLVASAGRVLGVYGLVGSGRTNLLRVIYGVEALKGGELLLFGRPYHPHDPETAIAAGIAYLSEERKADGFVPKFSAISNVTLPVLGRYQHLGVLRLDRAAAAASSALSSVQVVGDIQSPMEGLSGGNQQRALFGKVILQQPRLLLLDEPTKGVDVGARQAIHDIVRSIVRDHNTAAIVVSSEEEEILDLADDIVVFREGRCDGRVYSPSSLDLASLRGIAWTGAANASGPVS